MRFGHIEDVEAYYAKVEASPAYAKLFRPDADDIRQARIDANRVRRIRRPTIRTVALAAKRAGLEVAAIEQRPDGTIVVIPGTPVQVSQGDDFPIDASEWN